MSPVRLLVRLMYTLVHFAATQGGISPTANELESDHSSARQTGIRGETYAYWYLRNEGYIVVRQNYRVPNRKGEIDLIAWDGPTLAFVEVKTRTTSTGEPPEAAVDSAKRQHLVEMAREYIARRKLKDVRSRFDVLAIEGRRGAEPQVRLHRAAFTIG